MNRAQRMASNMGDLDAVVIVNGTEPFLDSTFWYLTGLDSGSFEGSVAVVRKDGSLDLIVSQLEEEIAKGGNGNLHVYSKRDEFTEFVTNLLKDCKHVGFNTHSVPYSGVQGIKKICGDIEIEDASKCISDTVNVKDASEIELIEKACRITSTVAQELPDMISEGLSEKQVASEMDIRMKRLGASGYAFDTIAAFGRYSAEPHHMPSDYQLREGDTALFDFGAKFGGYCADLTRTIFLGEPDAKLRRAYEIVREAQQAGIDAMRPGAKASDVDKAARDIIDSSEFKGLFIHSFGHGIGRDVHQNISASPRSEQVLAEGNVVSAEPGIYIPGLGGIRIEDTMLITKDGSRRLTSFDHSFTVSR